MRNKFRGSIDKADTLYKRYDTTIGSVFKALKEDKTRVSIWLDKLGWPVYQLIWAEGNWPILQDPDKEPIPQLPEDPEEIIGETS